MKPIVAAAVVLATLGGGMALAAPGAGEDENASLERLFVASDDEVWIANPGLGRARPRPQVQGEEEEKVVRSPATVVHSRAGR